MYTTLDLTPILSGHSPGSRNRLVHTLFSLARNFFTLAFVAMLGCEPVRPAQITQNSKPAPTPLTRQSAAFGDESSRRYDFGSVVGRPNLKLYHKYIIKNESINKLKIIRSINAKPCCGDVELIGPKSLDPGESITLTTTVRVGETVGPLAHRALVETDLPEGSILEFWTLANGIPRVRVDETSEKLEPLFPGQRARRTFVAFAYGTMADPPSVLDDGTVKATSGVTWQGPTQEQKLDDQIIEQSRTFTIELKAHGNPGPRSELISFVDGNDVVWHRQILWEVASAIKATPAGIIATPSAKQSDYRAFIRSQDHRAFEIVEAESDLLGVTAEVTEKGPRAVHAFRTIADPGFKSGSAF